MGLTCLFPSVHDLERAKLRFLVTIEQALLGRDGVEKAIELLSKLLEAMKLAKVRSQQVDVTDPVIRVAVEDLLKKTLGSSKRIGEWIKVVEWVLEVLKQAAQYKPSD
ncbi:MAG: hypothetical protein ACK4Z6_01180 [Candidatus Methylomirabilales bacterium]